MADSKSTSTQDVLTAIITNGVICAVFVTLFILLRLKFKRIYQPKSSFDMVPEDEKPEPLPQGPYQWIIALFKKEPAFIIKQAGLDGYLFIRYLSIMACMAFGGIFSWIILFPVNATNGKGETGLNQLGISNVGSPGRYYAHVFISWIYYGIFLFVLYRELYFYSSIRSLALSTPAYAKRISQRTVIFQTVTDQFLDEEQFYKLFEGVKRVWVTRAQKKLAKKVKERQNLVMKLEGALTNLLKKAMKAKLKADKKGEIIEPANEMVCYVAQKKRPSMRLKPVIGKKVDVIEHCKETLPKLNEEIEELQSTYKEVKPMNSVAVEFENQYYAQQAYQATIHHQPLHFSPKYYGVNPKDIYWPNMRLFWWERLVKRTSAMAAIVALVIFWAIPVSFVGFISNLAQLTNKWPWLDFIYNLPDVLLGLITSLLPTVLLAVLMMVLPIFIRGMAKISGCVTTQSIEYYTQQCYFAFQVIQVLLVTTISSSVASTATQIAEDPTSVMSLLSSNLPKSSNFFVSYIILQGFSISGGSLFQIVPFILFYALGSILDGTVRKKYTRFNTLGSYSWGTTFPIYTNLAVIFFAYALISPIIMLFAFAAFLFMYIAYMHNANYVFGKGADGLGQYYPRALFQTMVGVYLGEICLIGLFAVSKSWGCIVLEAIFLGFTVFVHLTLNQAYDHLLTVVPNSVMLPLDGRSETVSWKPKSKFGLLPSSFFELDNNQAEPKSSIDSKSPFYSKDDLNNIELKNLSSKDENGNGVINASDSDLVEVPLLADGEDYSHETEPRNFFLRFLQPNIYYSYHSLKSYMPDTFYKTPVYEKEFEEHAYDYPDVTAKSPIVWIPRDPMGLSTVEIENLRGIVEVSDENATFDDKGKIIWTGAPPSYQDATANDIDNKKKSSIFVLSDDDEYDNETANYQRKNDLSNDDESYYNKSKD
ncbi:hypothetical protein B5S29_g1788 [[Candida] boidinii]|nr:hypothetical protein B5S29_g1788 [[Candida] boidinii]